MKGVSREKFNLFEQPFRFCFQDSELLHLRQQFFGQGSILLRSQVIEIRITKDLLQQIGRCGGQSGGGNHSANLIDLLQVVSIGRKDVNGHLGRESFVTAVLLEVTGIVEQCSSFQQNQIFFLEMFCHTQMPGIGDHTFGVSGMVVGQVIGQLALQLIHQKRIQPLIIHHLSGLMFLIQYFIKHYFFCLVLQTGRSYPLAVEGLFDPFITGFGDDNLPDSGGTL